MKQTQNNVKLMDLIKKKPSKKYKFLKSYDNTKTIKEGSTGYPYIVKTDDDSIDDQRFDRTKSFLDFTMGKLDINNNVSVILTNDRKRYGLKTFAHFDPAKSICVVYSKGRNLADILRSIAHELVHKRQFDAGEIRGKVKDIGGPIEEIS